MAKVSPNKLFPSISVSSFGNGLTIDYNDLPGVTPDEIDPINGDASVLLRALIEKAYNGIQSMSATERPTRMTIVQGGQSIAPGMRNTIRQPYTATFDLAASDLEVAPEQ